jgi:hypothetical protein
VLRRCSDVDGLSMCRFGGGPCRWVLTSAFPCRLVWIMVTAPAHRLSTGRRSPSTVAARLDLRGNWPRAAAGTLPTCVSTTYGSPPTPTAATSARWPVPSAAPSACPYRLRLPFDAGTGHASGDPARDHSPSPTGPGRRAPELIVHSYEGAYAIGRSRARRTRSGVLTWLQALPAPGWAMERSHQMILGPLVGRERRWCDSCTPLTRPGPPASDASTAGCRAVAVLKMSIGTRAWAARVRVG